MPERPIVKDPIFLARKSRPATAEDLPIARDLLDGSAAEQTIRELLDLSFSMTE